MQKLKQIRLFTLLLIICLPLTIQIGYTCSFGGLRDIYLSWEEFRAQITMRAPKKIKQSGNILTYENLVFVVNPKQGVHIFDNTEPEMPINLGFLPIPGASQIGLKSGNLYAKSYSDLVVIDLSDPINAIEIARSERIFQNGSDPEKGIITEQQYDPALGGGCGGYGCALGGAGEEVSSGNEQPGGGTIGDVGSMSAMIIVGNHIYIIDHRYLSTIDITDPSNPTRVSRTFIGTEYETVFAYENNLYFGSRSGVHIFSLETPEKPTKTGSFAHRWQCDPVVVQNDIAFSTLRGGARCGGFDNQLDIIDVQDITKPTLIKTYPMTNPHGLAIRDNLLFLADGEAGLKVFNFEAPDKLTELSTLQSIEINGNNHNIFAMDLIVKESHGILVGKKVVIQFDYSNPNAIQVLSILN